MPVALKGATSGQVTLDVPATAGTNTLTLPAKTGNIITSADSGTVTQAMLASNVAGNGPAFSAYLTASQSIGNNTFTKVAFNATDYNQGSYFSTSTNRFTPLVAGYYQISVMLTLTSSGATNYFVALYNGGGFYKFLLDGRQGANSTGEFGASTSTLVYFNGSTDYIECWANINGSGASIYSAGSSTYSNMTAVLVRSA